MLPFRKRPKPAKKERIVTTSIKTMGQKFGAWRRYRDAVRELSSLTDRELSDIGIARDEIRAIAREHAAS